jgi:Co/Zn/Cd efflux system component
LVTVLVAVESLRRLEQETAEVRDLPMVIVSVVTMLVLFAGVLVLGASAATEDLHTHSVLLDTLADAGAAAGVAIASAIIAATNRHQWLDPVIALVIFRRRFCSTELISWVWGRDGCGTCRRRSACSRSELPACGPTSRH